MTKNSCAGNKFDVSHGPSPLINDIKESCDKINQDFNTNES